MQALLRLIFVPSIGIFPEPISMHEEKIGVFVDKSV